MFQPIIDNKKYVTYDEKPVFAEDYQAQVDSLKSMPVLTIMMQGPLKLEEHFTLETLKIYQKTFPNCPIVLSTWKTENPNEIQRIKALGIHVLLNDLPEIKDKLNMNFQILSTRNGLKYAKELGTEYVIKTRADQRFYETNIPEFLFNLMKKFPPYDPQKQKSRLVTLSMNTFKYRLYDISDMFLFGHIDDVIKFWSCDLREHTEHPISDNMLEYSKARPGEIYFTTEYLKKIGHNCAWTLEDSWLVYSRYFCIIDAVCVGIYWPKYSNIVNRWRNFFGALPGLEELTFKEWFNMYIGLDNKNVPEHLILNGWNKTTKLSFNEHLLATKAEQRQLKLQKLKKFLFEKRVTSKGYLQIKIFRLRILKVKVGGSK